MNSWMPWGNVLKISLVSTARSATQRNISIRIIRRNFSEIERRIQQPSLLLGSHFTVRLKTHRSAMSSPKVKNISVTAEAGLSTQTLVKSKEESRETTVSEAIGKQSAVIRYSIGDERFQFKLILLNGKVLNFDRSVADPLQSFHERMITNLTKKFKKFDGNLVLLESSVTDDRLDNNWEKVSTSVLLEDFLEQLVNGSKRMNVQVGEEVYDVAINPPEIFSIKFLKDSSVGFPIFPNKIETSSNFKRDESKFIWEFAQNPDVTVQQEEAANKPKKNKKGGNSGGVRNLVWKDTGCRRFVFTPGEELLGSTLRFTCVPSDGNGFGVPFSVELPSPVAPSLVRDPLYLERLGRMKPARKADLDFLRVVSYNCLADTYATEEWFISSPKGCLSPDFRLNFLNKELEAYGADLYCMQEVDEKYFERHFEPFFDCQLNYKGAFTSKIGNTREGVATFYNPEKLDLIRNESVEILEHMKTQSFWKSVSSLGEEVLNSLLNRNTVLQVSIFKPKAVQNTILLVANTHLYFYPDADHIRCLQTLTCVDYIERTILKLKNAFPSFKVALMFCGDFNCTPPFSSYRFLTTGKIEADDFDWTSHSVEKIIPGVSREHSLNLKNSHPGEELTNITTCFEGCLDYILYQPEHFKLLDVYTPPDKSVIASIIGVDEPRKVSLPNFNTPSDHLPLIGDFLLISQ